jgi:hypothetical protein
MHRISTRARRPLKWTQPKMMKMSYQLLDGEEELATMEFRSMFGSLATGRSADGVWTFKRTGFFNPVVTVRVEGSEKDIATFKNNTWQDGGTLALMDGRTYRASTNFWMTTYMIANESDEALVLFKRVGGLLHMSTEVEIQPVAAHKPELPWMVMLGWYLIVLMHQDQAAVASV